MKNFIPTLGWMFIFVSFVEALRDIINKTVTLGTYLASITLILIGGLLIYYSHKKKKH